MIIECPGLRSSRNGRRAMVHGSSLLRIGTCLLRMLSLSSDWWDVPLVRHGLLLSRGTGTDTAAAAVVADTSVGVVDNRCVVNVVNVGHVHVARGAVVVELAVLPASALVAVTVVSITVADTAVEANLLAPVTVVENI